MAAAFHEYLSSDHQRLDESLTASLRNDGMIDAESYGEFRRGLRRHIAKMMERLRAVPQIPLSPEADTPVVRRSITENLRLAAESRTRLEK